MDQGDESKVEQDEGLKPAPYDLNRSISLIYGRRRAFVDDELQSRVSVQPMKLRLVPQRL